MPRWCGSGSGPGTTPTPCGGGANRPTWTPAGALGLPPMTRPGSSSWSGEPGAEAGQRDPAGGLLVLRAGARPAFAVVVAFVDDHRDRFGVKPICRVLSEHGVPIASNSYHAHKKRGRSAR